MILKNPVCIGWVLRFNGALISVYSSLIGGRGICLLYRLGFKGPKKLISPFGLGGGSGFLHMTVDFPFLA